jgi:putative FmdB family regulatory protein
MPIFEFVCKKCSKKFDVLFRSSTEKKKVQCKHCGSEKVEKQFSLFGTNERPRSSAGSGKCGSCAKSSCAGCHH